MSEANRFKTFINSEKAGGVLLVFCAVVSMGLANSTAGEAYQNFWSFSIVHHSLTHWINDGLMAIFFLLVGLELKRELYSGELSTWKKAVLPGIAALGGMLVPAAIFTMLNFGLPTQPGAGIPMATDIAFALGILSLLGNRVPTSLKVFLTALAVLDDLGAIVVITVFYTNSISFLHLSGSLGIAIMLFIFNRLRIQSMIIYLLGGVFIWYFMLQSGVHATLAGVLLAFVIPHGKNNSPSLSEKLIAYLHKPVTFLILPLFALANTCIIVDRNVTLGLTSMNSIGIFTGLVVGKPLGIFLFSVIAIAVGVCTLPERVNKKQLLGIGFLGGIGFTMSVFVSLLAFDQEAFITQSKIAILSASLIAALLGYGWLRKTLPDSADQ